MTDTATDDRVDDAATRERIEALQRRRSATPPTPRQHAGVAQGSKIAAAGFGVAAMLGLVAAMGYADQSSATSPEPEPPAAVPAPVVVVIHPPDVPSTVATTPVVQGEVPPSSNQPILPSTVPIVPNGAPIVLTAEPIVLAAEPVVRSAQPTVRQAPASQAPSGQTNGSS